MCSNDVGYAISALPSFDGWQFDPQADYGGSDRKDGLLDANGTRYMVKFAEAKAHRNDLSTKHVNNALSEYMSSHILGILGYPVQETILGTLNGELVVACRNFVPQGEKLIEFGTFMRKHYDSTEVRRVPNIRQIHHVLETDRMLSKQADRFKAVFWDRFAGDALVGNFDRHIGNFGYLVGADGSVTETPIYDNGSTLFPNLSEPEMEAVLDDPKEIMRRIMLFPKAALELRPGVKAEYYEFMSSGICSDLTEAVVRMVPRICRAMPAVMDFINNCDFLSDLRKDFYSVMLAERMYFILEAAYDRCVSGCFDLDIRKRMESCASMDETEFEDYWHAAEELERKTAGR